jgi:hypothetical protein
MDGDDMVLVTEPGTDEEGRIIVNRMVFTDITPDSLYWQWQKSTDAGDTWSDLWTITYKRRV